MSPPGGERIGRNDPCPCGSGKKYKKCHMRQEQRAEKVSAGRSNAVGVLAGWLYERFPEATEDAVTEAYFRPFADEGPPPLAQLDPGLAQMLGNNVDAWLCADAKLVVDGEEIRAVELMRRPGGPLLTAEQRDWLERFAAAPLRLYEVGEVRPGVGLEIIDLMPGDGAETDEGQPVFVRERSASRTLTRRAVLACRVIHLGDHWVIGGDVYAFSDTMFARSLARQISGDGFGPGHREDAAQRIIWAWLDTLLPSGSAPAPIPQMVDRRTGEPIMLCTDHYEVLDASALDAALDAAPDVELDSIDEGDHGPAGDHDDTNRWVRLAPAGPGEDDDFRSILLTINPGPKPDRIEVFTRSEAAADEGRAWLVTLAGAAIRHRLRELTDPESIFREAKERGSDAPRSQRDDPLAHLSPEDRGALIQQLHEKLYNSWAETAVPALGGLTPRAAVESSEGRLAVSDLLKDYESHDARAARDENRLPVDYGFLWESVSLSSATADRS